MSVENYGILVTDHNTRITHVNAGFTQITGYSSQEAVGQYSKFLQGSGTSKEARESIRRSMDKKEDIEISLLNYRKDGSTFLNHLTISPIFNEHGQVSSYVGIQLQIGSTTYVDQPMARFRWTEIDSSESKIGRLHSTLKIKAEDEDTTDDEDEAERYEKERLARQVDAIKHISFVAETKLPTTKGYYRVRAYKDHRKNAKLAEIICIISGKVENMAEVPCRVHDQCFTSEVLGSMKCDCREQLDFAMEYIRDNPDGEDDEGFGMVIYMPQEGRGIGLGNKIKAYSMQEHGLDTVDANRILGFPDDLREYSAVHAIFSDLGIKSVKLMTNNPRKIEELTQCGVEICGQLPCHVELSEHSLNYLASKRARMGHKAPPM